MSTEQFQALIKQAEQLPSEERRQLIDYLAKADRDEAQTQSAASGINYLALFGSGWVGFENADETDQDIRNDANVIDRN